MNSYCAIARGHQIHGSYHDLEYGFPVRDDAALFERLVLEINQAGLSWEMILRRREGFREAYARFDPFLVARFDDADRARLRGDARVIRNRLKIDAAIHNASVVLELRELWGSFADWLDAHHPRDVDDWVRLFRQTFRFTGPEIVREFLLSTGYLSGAHDRDCETGRRIAELAPPWMATPDGRA